MKILIQNIHIISYCVLCIASMPLYAQSQNYKWDQVAIGGGGYVTGLVIHPTTANLMYMRTDIGGIFRWDHVNNLWISLSTWINPEQSNLFGVDGIALDKNNPDVVYAALGKYAVAGSTQPAGIYKSTDKGINWTKVHDAQFGGNWRLRWAGEPIAVDPNNSNIVYCGTRLNGLLRSNSGGGPGTWSEVAGVPRGNTGDASNPWPESNNPIGIRSVVIDGSTMTNDRSRNIYVGVFGTGIFHSSNGGTSFELMSGSPSDVVRMALAPNNTLYVTTQSSVRKFNGSSWSKLPVPSDIYSTYNGIAVDPFNTNRLYVATGAPALYQRLYRSTDSGASWSIVCPFEGSANINDTTWHKGNLAYWNAASASLIFDPHKNGRLYMTDWYQV